MPRKYRKKQQGLQMKNERYILNSCKLRYTIKYILKLALKIKKIYLNGVQRNIPFL